MKLSVILPIYNEEKTIAFALESVIYQRVNFEYEIKPEIEKVICHQVRIAIIGETGEKIFTIEPKKKGNEQIDVSAVYYCDACAAEYKLPLNNCIVGDNLAGGYCRICGDASP
jgi:hypothetical protein